MTGLNAFLNDYGVELLNRTGEHLLLTFLAMMIACAIAVPLGVLLARVRVRWLVTGIMGIVNFIQPIPSLALVALMAALFFMLNRTIGIRFLPAMGLLPALVALVAYALLPILRNTYTGLRQVDPAAIEVARGMGMTSWQTLLNVELPLAMPVIMAGIRTSTVWTIGVATLVSMVGAGGLGALIFRGLSNYRIPLILGGAVPAAILALGFDWLLAWVEKLLTPMGIQQTQR